MTKRPRRRERDHREMNCPHCDRPLPTPPPGLECQEFWQCGCGGLYGVMLTEPVAYPVPSIKTLRIRDTVLISRARRWAFYGDRPYVYALCGPLGLPFYVGRGTGQRLTQHEKEADTLPADVQTEKHATIHTLRRNGFDVRYSILDFCDSVADAAEMEAAIIRRYGRRRDRSGCLTNAVAPSLNDPERTESRPEPPEAGWEEESEELKRLGALPVENPDNYDDGKSLLGERSVIQIRCPACNRLLSYFAHVARRQCRCPECLTWLVPSEVRRGERIKLID